MDTHDDRIRIELHTESHTTVAEFHIYSVVLDNSYISRVVIPLGPDTVTGLLSTDVSLQAK